MKRAVQIILKTITIILGVVLLCAGGAMGTFLWVNSPPSGEVLAANGVEPIGSTGARIAVKEGESATQVGFRLKDAGFIRSRLVWQLLCHLRPEYLQAGMYQFDTKLPLLELHEVFTSGKQLLVSVTIPEGSTLKKTARILAEASVCSAEDFLEAASNPALLREYNVPAATMEGYLYPDTYHLTLNYPAAMAVRKMADNFYRRLKSLGIETSSMSAEDIFFRVILASIVEREYRIEDEAPVMAGVFLRRMEKGMRLESCATVVYVLTEIEGKEHPKTLFYSDLDVESPYNTYRHSGLPPSPISSPGAVALSAAFYPEKTEYLFFRIVDPQAGRHYFSKNFDDHIKAGLFAVK